MAKGSQVFDYETTIGSGPPKKGEPERERPVQRDEDGSQIFDYDTVASMGQVRSDIRGSRTEHLNRFAGPIMSPAPQVPTSVVMDERNSRILKNRYGGQFNEEEPYTNLPVIMDMSYSDRFSEKKAKFKDYYPQGDIKQETVGNKKITLARESKDEPYRVYEDTILADIAHPGTVGALAGVAAAPYTGGGSLTMAGLTGLGTTIGEMGLYGTEAARGYQHTPLDEGMANAAILGGLSSSIDLATMGAGRLTGIARRVPGRSKGADVSVRAERTAERQGLEPPMAGQLTQAPLIPQIFRQAGATYSKVGRRMDQQEKRLLTRMRDMSDTDYGSVSDNNLHKMMELQRRELEDIYAGAPQATSPEEFGEAEQVALERYKEISRRARDRLYRKAKNEGETLEFSIGDAQAVADKYLKGGKTRTRGGRGAGGRFASGGEQRVGPAISPKLRRLLQQVQNSQSRVRTFVDSEGTTQESIDQLKELRTGFYDFMVDGDGVEKRIATEMWHNLKKSMENPVAGKKSARDTLKRANQANAVREANLEIGSIRKALRTEEPGKLLHQFRPGNQRTVQTIKRLSGKKWEGIKNEFLGTLVSDPRSGVSLLNAFKKDKGTLREIMSADEEDAMRSYLQELKKMDDGKLNKLADSQINRAHRVKELTEEGQEKLQETVSLAGGRGSRFAEDARRGLLREAADKATTVSQDGEQIINSQRLVDELNNILKSDKYKPIMTKSFDRDARDLLAYLTKISRPEGDLGTSLETAQLAASGKHLLTQGTRALAAWGTAGLNVVTGSLLMRPRLFRRILQKEGVVDERIIRGMTQLAKDLNEDAERIGGEEPGSAMYEIFQRKLGDEMR